MNIGINTLLVFKDLELHSSVLLFAFFGFIIPQMELTLHNL